MPHLTFQAVQIVLCCVLHFPIVLLEPNILLEVAACLMGLALLGEVVESEAFCDNGIWLLFKDLLS